MSTLTRLALLGKGISHSRSPEIYRRLISPTLRYDLLDVAERSLVPSWQELAKAYQGINITTPWKEVFAPFAVPEVAHLGAVNCLRLEDSRCVATNTDWSALLILLPKMLGMHGCESTCVLLGSGVMARIVTDVCDRLSIKVEHYARSRGDDLATLDLLNSQPGDVKRLLVNACGRDFNFTGNLRGAWVFWDFNYAHAYHSAHVPSGKVSYVDGRELLELQAEHAVQFWNPALTH